MDTTDSKNDPSDGKAYDEDLDKKFPNRPRNHSKTLPFHDLYMALFNPLNDNRKKPTGPTVARKKLGPRGLPSHSPHEVRQNIIQRFISRWRQEVGNDIYPAFRLIIPEKDRERAMYGIKEKTIAKILIMVMKINKDSEDGYNLLNWKQPGHTSASKMAGDFAGRCFEVISKRPMRIAAGNMTIGEVNDMLDRLAAAGKEEYQKPIFAEFYQRMNADELMWLIRIILRQMKVGATERTFFDIWHPDAEILFNVSSNLRRVCWELYNPNIRLQSEEQAITLMQCFQPQLAQFQMHSFQKMIDKLHPTEDDAVFWIEEKLDGERMQLHMVTDENTPGGKRFCFWSRKAKDYTYLYGSGFMDQNSALTRHLRNAFDEGVENIILDGEMITWDLEQDAMVPFGTLKTAAIGQQNNPYSTGWRPLYKVFDILYLNSQVLTNYTLRDRRRALDQAVKGVPRRLEVHTYKEGESIADIEPLLRQVVAEASEGLVLKNPRSAYRLNQRNDDWLKVKPEYMTEFGENLDCVVIGGYYGSGHRGGRLSSFLCGLRVDDNQIQQGANPMKCYSFFKVGGGFTSTDYAAIRHQTDGKWKKWDPKHPPTEYIALAGDNLQYERPDEWILPCDSVVLEVKAASVAQTDQFKMGCTLRFPRFKKIRTDRTWDNALSVFGFMTLKNNAEKEKKENEFRVDDSRRKRQKLTRKRPLTVVDSEPISLPLGEKATKVFEGLKFYVMTGSQKPQKRSKAELEQMIKANGGSIFQVDSRPQTICIGSNNTVRVASTIKRGNVDILEPSWLFDNIKQSERDGDRSRFILPYEPRHMFYATPESKGKIMNNADRYGDSFARDVSIEELKEIFDNMPQQFEHDLDVSTFRSELEEHDHSFGNLGAWMFQGLLIYPTFSQNQEDTGRNSRMSLACNNVRFSGGTVTADLEEGVTHILVSQPADKKQLKNLRQQISTFSRGRLPKVVSLEWVEYSWRDGTRLDEDRFAPMLQ